MQLPVRAIVLVGSMINDSRKEARMFLEKYCSSRCFWVDLWSERSSQGSRTLGYIYSRPCPLRSSTLHVMTGNDRPITKRKQLNLSQLWNLPVLTMHQSPSGERDAKKMPLTLESLESRFSYISNWETFLRSLYGILLHETVIFQRLWNHRRSLQNMT